MTSRRKTILILLTLYALTMGGLTIYHAINFSDYIHWKGDEVINYTLFLLVTSILFQGLVYVFTKSFDLKAATLATIVNFIVSFIVGFGLLLISGLSGIPRHLIFLYGGCYLTLFTIITIWQAKKQNRTEVIK